MENIFPPIQLPEFCRGDPVPQLQWQEREFDPTRGYVYHYDLHGLSQAQMIILQNQLSSLGIESKLHLEKDAATLSAIDSTATYTIDTWQVNANDESLDILSNPNFMGAINAYIVGMAGANTHSLPDIVSSMRSAINAGDTLDQLVNSTSNTIFGVLSSSGISYNNTTVGAVWNRFFSLASRGTTEFRQQQYVLRHTTNAPANWQGGGAIINVADIGVDTIYTRAQCLSEVTSPASWIFPLPARLITKISYIPQQFSQANDPCQYLWGFLKGPSTETTAANNRVEIVTEYILALWSTDLYAQFSNWTLPSP